MKFLVSLAASTQQEARPGCLMVQDIKKAFFYAPAIRTLYVDLPPEALGPGEENLCGRLRKSLYGTRDAALNWSEEHTRVLLAMGFVKGERSPCTFYHPSRSICLTVHGDDFVSVGALEDLTWMDVELKKVVK